VLAAHGVFTGVRSPQMSGSGGLLKGMKKGFSSSLEGPVGKVSSGVGKMGKGINTVGKGVTRVAATAGGQTTATTGMRTELHTDLLALKASVDRQSGSGSGSGGGGATLGDVVARLTEIKTTTAALGTGILTQIKGVLDNILTAVRAGNRPPPAEQEFHEAGTNPGSIYTHDIHIEELLTQGIKTLNNNDQVLVDKIAPHIEAIATYMGAYAENEQAKPTVTKKEVDEQIQQRVAAMRPSGSTAEANEQLAQIAANTAQTVEELKEAVAVLREIQDLMEQGGQSSGGAGAGDTKPNQKPRGTPNYYTWQFGRYGDTAAKQYTNNGV